MCLLAQLKDHLSGLGLIREATFACGWVDTWVLGPGAERGGKGGEKGGGGRGPACIAAKTTFCLTEQPSNIASQIKSNQDNNQNSNE